MVNCYWLIVIGGARWCDESAIYKMVGEVSTTGLMVIWGRI